MNFVIFPFSSHMEGTALFPFLSCLPGYLKSGIVSFSGRIWRERLVEGMKARETRNKRRGYTEAPEMGFLPSLAFPWVGRVVCVDGGSG